MTRVIDALLDEAAEEFAETDVVSVDTQARLEAEGYMLSALARDASDRAANL